MKTYPLRQLCFCVVLSVFSACSSSNKTANVKAEKSLPELPFSELDIPIRIAAAPFFAKAESLVPAEFKSDAWPDFMRPSCDFRYKYRFVRTALHISCTNNIVGVQFGGNYQVSGSKCLCTAGIPVTPWVSGNCGFAPQPLRRVNMAISTRLQFLPTYQLRTTTAINQVQPLDKCEVSVFSSDITQLIMDSIRSSLVAFTMSMDQTIAGLNFSKFVTKLRDDSYRKIPIGKYGYFLLAPTALRIGQLNYIKDSFSISIGITCKPELSSDPRNYTNVPASLPALLQTENRNGVRLYLNMKYDYEFLTGIMRDSLRNRVFEVKGRTLVIKDASIRGVDNDQIELKIDFAGSNHGSIYLRGTPVLDSLKQTLSISDLTYSMEGEDLALKIARSLFKNKIRKSIQGKSYLDISAFLTTNKTSIDQQLNREWLPGFRSTGVLREAKITALLVTRQDIQLQLFIGGELKLAGGNL